MKRCLTALMAWSLLTSTAMFAARSFNGTNQSMGTTSSVAISGVSVITLSFWLNVASFGTGVYIESSSNPNSNTGAFGLSYGTTGSCTNYFYFYARNAGGYQVAGFAPPSTGVWHHYTLVINDTASSSAAYVDGAPQSVTVCMNTGTPSTFLNFPLFFMARNNASGYNAGSLADVAIWNVALTANEAKSLANCLPPPVTHGGSNLKGYWPLWGVDSPEADYSGNALPASVTGATTGNHVCGEFSGDR